MAQSAESNPAPGSDLQVSVPDVVRFVRQLAHDLRNDLNAAELQSAYLIEIAENDEIKEEVKRLRGMIAQVGVHLQGVTASLSQTKLTPISYSAGEFVEDLRQKLSVDYPDQSAKVEWNVAAGNSTLQIDPQFLLPAVTELFANAFRHEPADGVISVETHPENDRFILTIREPKRTFSRSTDDWGREPFRTVGQGHYGLGLHRARTILEAHEGQLSARYDPAASSLVTTVSLPATPASS
jgi:two-component system sensor histidine kinase ResE